MHDLITIGCGVELRHHEVDLVCRFVRHLRQEAETARVARSITESRAPTSAGWRVVGCHAAKTSPILMQTVTRMGTADRVERALLTALIEQRCEFGFVLMCDFVSAFVHDAARGRVEVDAVEPAQWHLVPN